MSPEVPHRLERIAAKQAQVEAQRALQGATDPPVGEDSRKLLRLLRDALGALERIEVAINTLVSKEDSLYVMLSEAVNAQLTVLRAIKRNTEPPAP